MFKVVGFCCCCCFHLAWLFIFVWKVSTACLVALGLTSAVTAFLISPSLEEVTENNFYQVARKSLFFFFFTKINLNLAWLVTGKKTHKNKNKTPSFATQYTKQPHVRETPSWA